MWIEDFDTVLLGPKATPDTAPFYLSKIGLPIEWGSAQVKEKYDSAGPDTKESMKRAAFRAMIGVVLGNASSKVEVSASMTGKELTMRDEKEIPDFRYWVELKDSETDDPKAVLFAIDWKDKAIKRKHSDNTETDAIYLWHLQKSPSKDYFKQLMLFRAEYGYYFDFRYYVLRMPGQKIMPTRKADGNIDLAAFALEEPGMWVQWKIKEQRTEQFRGILRDKYFPQA